MRHLMLTETYTEEQLQALDIDDLDRMAYGVADDDVVEIDPRLLTIKWECDLANPEEKFRLGGKKWVDSVDLSEPVEISIAQDGTIHLEDGHHRRFAALKRGEKLRATVVIKGNPVLRVMQLQAEGNPLYPPFAASV